MKRVFTLGLGIWLVVSLVGGGLLLAPHLLALPVPAKTDAKLQQAVATVWVAPGEWRATHIMYRSCPCSRRTLAHLLAGPRPAGLAELVVMVDDDGQATDADDALRLAGFRIEVITPAILRDRFDVEGVPLLVVARPGGELAYVGGYNRHKQSTAFEDVEIIQQLRERETRTALPVFGCATTARLADALDPLGLRKW